MSVPRVTLILLATTSIALIGSRTAQAQRTFFEMSFARVRIRFSTMGKEMAEPAAGWRATKSNAIGDSR